MYHLFIRKCLSFILGFPLSLLEKRNSQRTSPGMQLWEPSPKGPAHQIHVHLKTLISEGNKLLFCLNHQKYYYGSCIGYVFVCENACTHVCVYMWRLGGQRKVSSILAFETRSISEPGAH